MGRNEKKGMKKMAQPWLSSLPTELELEKLRNEKEALDYIMKIIHEWRMRRAHSSEIFMAYLTINQAHDDKWGRNEN